MFNLQPWRPAGLLSDTRTRGQIGFHKNGTALDIWIRVNGKETWFSVPVKGLVGFLLTTDETMEVLDAESGENAEKDAREPWMPTPYRSW